MPPLVSICINNYNYERFLRDSIESALQQSYRPIEVIVVDDGSTDGSRGILAEYSDRVTIILQENLGQSSAANSAFSVSSGDIVVFLDSDDMLKPNAVEAVVRNWLPGTVKVHFALAVIDGEGNALPIRIPRLPLDSGDVTPLLLKYGHYVTSPMSGNAYSRKALIPLMPIPESWKISGHWVDAYLGHLVPFAGPIVSLNEPHGFYRIHSRNHSPQLDRSRDATITKLRNYLVTEVAVKRILENQAAKVGRKVHVSAVTGSYSCLKAWLALIKLGGRLDELPPRTVFELCLCFLRVVWTGPSMTLADRIGLSCWGLVTALCPTRLTNTVVSLGMSPSARPAWISKLAAGPLRRQVISAQ